ncbi:MAG: tetratricopeptide repeat protein [Parcubacteria group bacterium]
MLYSIIPPILIVASLVAIIIFLVKKLDKVSQLSIEEIVREEEERKIMMEDAGFFQKISLKIKNIKWDDFKHGLLGMLEKITRKSRVVFLKLESKFGGWSENIREKRKARTERKMQVQNAGKKENIFQKIREYKPERKMAQLESKEEIEIKKPAFERRAFKKTEDDPARNASHSDAGGEKIIKPIISEKMVRPRKAEMKDRLEELLIERIAANPKDLEAYERLGQYYIEIKGYADAKECFKQVIKLDPGNRNAKYRLKRLESLLTQ